MKLVTKQLEKQIPGLRTQSEGKIEDLIYYAKLFTPWSNWTWYIAEANFETGECFGLVEGLETELGYFSLEEIREIRGPGGLKIERDMNFTQCTHQELKGGK